jgi:hypothetical protein
MKRSTQYGILLAVIGIAAAVSYVGFVHTGGALPWGKRFAAVMQGGTSAGSGSVFQFGRGGLGGFVLAGPLRDKILPFLLMVVVVGGGSAGLYWWSESST